jgi:glycine betaine/proline transport system substrate-binding protein
MKKSMIGLLLAGVLASVMGAQAQTISAYCAAGRTVKFAGITWESGQFTTEVLRYILEKGYGCRTEVVLGSSAVTETALVAGDLQIWGEQWEGRSAIVARGIADGRVRLVGNILDGGTVEGWFVPTYVIKGDAQRNISPAAPTLRSVTDLVRYRHIFRDPERPHLGRFYNCIIGWTCERINNQKLRAYGLDRYFVNFRPGSGAALDAAIAGAYERGRPIFFYYWAPSGLMARFDVTRLEEPEFNEACWSTLMDPNHPRPCGSAYPSINLRFGVSSTLPADDVINDLLSQVQFPLAFFNQILAEIGIYRKPVAQVAREFLVEQQDMWTRWVPADVAARVIASLR